MINVTEAAAEKITELLTEEHRDGAGLRVFVQGGGCSGFQYGLMIDDGEGNPDTDKTFEVNGVRSWSIPSACRISRAPRSTLSTTTWAGASPSRTRTPSPPADADPPSRPRLVAVRPRLEFVENIVPRADAALANAT
jgi:hypothetical protein